MTALSTLLQACEAYAWAEKKWRSVEPAEGVPVHDRVLRSLNDHAFSKDDLLSAAREPQLTAELREVGEALEAIRSLAAAAAEEIMNDDSSTARKSCWGIETPLATLRRLIGGGE